ncbi:hypothetical protein ASPBRDRAFT_541725 [Aspergillus brasiliensis CBS 101740]|uniref:Uncharacterized protein n=1 Tax=Aspergillus brasiliensis (strain CBS 101740 / IMI 381727 / IBT 21946) TaxID=767769 RepID=A0A1L9ULS4_ASPBC|nr:hypothetical protein ASPBRDRAFT_541725 [Aspergillus brasiliensis CBS 101740]
MVLRTSMTYVICIEQRFSSDPYAGRRASLGSGLALPVPDASHPHVMHRPTRLHHIRTFQQPSTTRTNVCAAQPPGHNHPNVTHQLGSHHALLTPLPVRWLCDGDWGGLMP